MSNPFIKNKNIIADLSGLIAPSDTLLFLAWEQLINYLGYDPIIQDRIDRDVEVGDSNRLYTVARPITKVNKLLVNGREAPIEFIEPTFIKYTYVRNSTYREFPYLPYALNKVYCEYEAGYEEDELPYAFYMFAALYTQFIADNNDLASYSIDTVSMSYRDHAETVNKFMNLLNPFRVVVI